MKNGTPIIRAYTSGATIAVVFLVFLTILAELQVPLKDWLKTTFSHHWIGKGVLTAALFIVAGFLLSSRRRNSDEEEASRWIVVLAWTVILGTVVLYFFFLYETLRHA